MPRNKEKNDAITRERREEILRTAIRKFSQKGYQGTNISDIAKELGVSQGIIFWYFSTKEQLFKTAFMEEFKAVKLTAAVILQDTGLTPEDRLKKLISEMITFYHDRKEGCMLVLQLISNKEMQQILSIDIINMYSELYNELDRLFKEAGAANPELKARNFVALLDGFMIQIILGLDIGNPSVLVEDILHRYELI
jgi:AcrR family transcriptional regulator